MPNQPFNKYQGVDYGTAAGMGVQDVLGGLLKLAASPFSVGGTMLGNIAGTPAGQTPDVMAGTGAALNNPLGPYQKGVAKALTQAGQAHAAEALQQGVNPNDIQSHPIMQNSTQNPLPNTGISTGDSTQTFTAPTSTTSSQPSQQSSQNPLQILSNILGIKGGDVVNGAYQPRQALGFLGENPESIIAHAQAANLGQQTQNITPKGALALETAKAQTPLNTYEKASLAAGGFSAQTAALNDQLQRMTQDQTALENLMKTYETTRGPFNKMAGGPSREMKQLQNQWSALQQSKAKIHTQLASLYGKQPNFNPSSVNGGSLPSRESAPPGAKGWDTDKGQWV